MEIRPNKTYIMEIPTPEGMVRTFTHEEPSSFETLESEISPSWEPIKTFVIVSVLVHSLLIPS